MPRLHQSTWEKFDELGRMVSEIAEHTGKQTSTLVTILHTRPEGEIISNDNGSAKTTVLKTVHPLLVHSTMKGHTL